MTRVLIVTADVIRERMAGPAIRAWEIATELSKTHEVVLVSVSGVPTEKLSPLFQVHSDTRDARLKEQLSWAEVLITQGTVLTGYPWMLRSKIPIVVDLYDPMHLEMVEQSRNLPMHERVRMVSTVTDILDVQIQRADFMLCASSKQRDFWLGQLAANGRLNPFTYDADGELDNLLTVVPFGLGADAPIQTAHGVKGIVPGIEADDEVLIWGGGIYNWFDPLTLIRAMEVVQQRRPKARLFFMGSGHPNPSVPQMAVAGEAFELAAQLDLLDRVVFFNEGWVPYEERMNYLLDASIGVSTHRLHLETEFSFRTRILDYLWAGLPMVVTEGDGFAQLVERRGLGCVVPEGDVHALADAIVRVLSDAQLRTTMSERVVEAADEFRWPVVLQPLVAFCDNPRTAADRVSGIRHWPRNRQHALMLSWARHSELLLFVRRIRYEQRREQLSLFGWFVWKLKRLPNRLRRSA